MFTQEWFDEYHMNFCINHPLSHITVAGQSLTAGANVSIETQKSFVQHLVSRDIFMEEFSFPAITNALCGQIYVS